MDYFDIGMNAMYEYVAIEDELPEEMTEQQFVEDRFATVFNLDQQKAHAMALDFYGDWKAAGERMLEETEAAWETMQA